MFKPVRQRPLTPKIRNLAGLRAVLTKTGNLLNYRLFNNSINTSLTLIGLNLGSSILFTMVHRETMPAYKRLYKQGCTLFASYAMIRSSTFRTWASIQEKVNRVNTEKN
jgi:hypothetical protein